MHLRWFKVHTFNDTVDTLMPEIAEFLKAIEGIKKKAFSTIDLSRAFIRDILLSGSDECLSLMTRSESCWNLISRLQMVSPVIALKQDAFLKLKFRMSYIVQIKTSFFIVTIAIEIIKILQLLSEFKDWLGDGKFYVASSFF